MSIYRRTFLFVCFLTLCSVFMGQKSQSLKGIADIDLSSSQLEKLTKALDDARRGQYVWAPIAEDGTRKSCSITTVVGKVVRVEGFLWGGTDQHSSSPNAGPRVVFDGGFVYVKGNNISECNCRGKIVHVTGTVKRVVSPISRIPGKTTKRPDSYYIQAQNIQALDVVEAPYIVLCDDE